MTNSFTFSPKIEFRCKDHHQVCVSAASILPHYFLFSTMPSFSTFVMHAVAAICLILHLCLIFSAPGMQNNEIVSNQNHPNVNAVSKERTDAVDESSNVADLSLNAKNIESNEPCIPVLNNPTSNDAAMSTISNTSNGGMSNTSKGNERCECYYY